MPDTVLGKKRKSSYLNDNDSELLSIIQSGGAYTPIIQPIKSPILTADEHGIKKEEVYVEINRELKKLDQYTYNEKSRDHRTAIASKIRYHKDELLKNNFSADIITKFVIKDSQNRILRVDPMRKTRDFVILPLSKQKGAGTEDNPYKFTNKGLSYADKLNEGIKKSSSMFERGRNDLAGILGQIISNDQNGLKNAIFASKGGVKKMKEVQEAADVNNKSVKIVINQLKTYAPSADLSNKSKLEEFLKKNRNTPERSSLVIGRPLPPLDLGSPALLDESIPQSRSLLKAAFI